MGILKFRIELFVIKIEIFVNMGHYGNEHFKTLLLQLGLFQPNFF